MMHAMLASLPRLALRWLVAFALLGGAACGADTACLTKAYDARIAALQAQVKDQMQQYCKAIQLC